MKSGCALHAAAYAFCWKLKKAFSWTSFRSDRHSQMPTDDLYDFYHHALRTNHLIQLHLREPSSTEELSSLYNDILRANHRLLRSIKRI